MIGVDKMVKALITGGGGFIGGHLTDKLLQEGFEVVVFDISEQLPYNLQHNKENKNFKYISGDILNKKALDQIITKDYDIIFNLASMVGVKNYVEDPLRTIDVTIIGTRNVIDLALKHEIKILFTSTSEVFGRNPKVPWDEDDDRVLGSTRVDRWVYSSSKALCEHILFAVHKKYGLPIVITRYFNAYGPRQQPILVVPAMIKNVLMGKNPVVFDNGEQTRSFTFIEDSIEGTFRAATTKEGVGNAFNIGSQFERTMNELGNLIIKVAGLEGKLSLEHKDSSEVYSSYEDIIRRIPGVEKAKQLLDWKATITPEEGIKRTYEWYKAHPEFLNI
jgi:UDP-glucose 4-epimerase